VVISDIHKYGQFISLLLDTKKVKKSGNSNKFIKSEAVVDSNFFLLTSFWDMFYYMRGKKSKKK